MFSKYQMVSVWVESVFILYVDNTVSISLLCIVKYKLHKVAALY
jgi:hypothetical protein